MNICERIKNKWSFWQFEVLYYSSPTQELKIKCLHCNTEKTYKNLYNLLNKQTPCVCTSNSSQYKSLQQIQELKEFFNNNSDFNVITWEAKNSKESKPSVTIEHKLCGRIFTKRTNYFYYNRVCPYCDGNSFPDTLEISARCENKGYTLLTPYKTLQDEVLIQHKKCGFIWKIKPYRFYKELDGTCPMCNKRVSKGEQAILNYLNKKNITFSKEYSFTWQSHKNYRYDFYVPAYNLIIEYNGRQHYEEVKYFHYTLKENQEHDSIKQQEALLNGYYYIVIPYTQYTHIESILDNWFNDYPKGVNNKLTVIERNNIYKDKNIV